MVELLSLLGLTEKEGTVPENRKMSREGQFGEETWLAGSYLGGREPRARTSPPPCPLWTLHTAAMIQDSRCRNPSESQRTGKALEVALRSLQEQKDWWDRAERGIWRSKWDLTLWAQIPMYRG